ncbi:MAG: bifunctional sugar-1-phosphate nucleotidylyltransferase/acetyltransferase [Candidatus Micrarchaeia archaeon]
MKAVILAAGNGKRVFPLAVNKPKPMFKLLGKPLMEYVVEELAAAGFKEAVCVVGHNAEQIKDYFGAKSHGVKISYALQKEAKGMADALACARGALGKTDKFVVVNADDVFEPGLLKAMLAKATSCDAVFASQPTEETWKFGILDLKGDRVRRIVEKPDKGKEPSKNAVIGVYILNSDIFRHLAAVPESDSQYEEAIQKMIDAGGDVRALSYKGFFGSYKLPWDLLRLNEYFLDKQKAFTAKSARISERAVIKGEHVHIGEGVRVFENAVIEGPCYIGDNAVIGNNALVRGHSSIGAKSVIGYSTEVKYSVIGENCWTHSAYVGDSVLGDNCSLGAGTITANFRFDEAHIQVEVLGKGKMDSGTNKLGVIMADNCKTGSNATIMPGVKVGPHSIVGSGVLLYKDLAPNKFAMQSKNLMEIRDNTVTLDNKAGEELRKKLLKYAPK